MVKLDNNRPLKMPLILAAAAIALGILIYFFANLREERAVQSCFESLQKRDLNEAYQIWGPTEQYTFNDFLKDWGEDGYYGQVHYFQIVESESKGNGVIVRVQINNLARPIAFWVERKNRRIGFAPTEL